MQITVKGKAKEIAALVLEIQGRRTGSLHDIDEQRDWSTLAWKDDSDERQSLIRVYERRMEKLKSGASPANVIF